MLGAVLAQTTLSPALIVAFVVIAVLGLLAVVVSLRIARRLRAIGDEGMRPDEEPDDGATR